MQNDPGVPGVVLYDSLLLCRPVTAPLQGVRYGYVDIGGARCRTSERTMPVRIDPAADNCEKNEHGDYPTR